MPGDDIESHRNRLEDLRREVEALNLVNAAAGQGLPVEGVAEPSVAVGDAAKFEGAPNNGIPNGYRFEKRNRRLELRVEDLEARRDVASQDLEAAEVERKEVIAMQCTAKADWNKVLTQCAAREQKAKKRIADTRKEIEKLQSTMRQAEAAHKCEREKAQQRVRNYRMQLRQMARQMQEVAIEEVGEDADDLTKALSRQNKSSAGVFLQVKTFAKENERLKRLRTELQEKKVDLEEKLRTLQKKGHLSDRAAELLELEARQKEEEDAYAKEGRELRSELQEMKAEEEAARRELARREQVRERTLAQLNEREWAFRKHQESETQKLQIIDEYLRLNGQQALNDRVEAEIGQAQYKLVQNRLEEAERDASARVHVLEASIQELKADIARKAAVVAELSARLGGSRYASSPLGGKTAEDRAAEAFRDEALRNMGVMTEGDISDASGGPDLERRAAEAELEHQRGLLDLRKGQVDALETRLVEYAEAQAPYCDAIRFWLASQVQRFGMKTAPRLERREEVEMMHQAKTEAFQQTREVWESERQRLTEESEAARKGAEASAKRLREVEAQREHVLKRLDRVLKAERAHGQRSAPLLKEVERERDRQIRQEVAHRLQETPPSARRRTMLQHVQSQAREHVIAQRRCQSEILSELTAQHRDVAAELTVVDEALTQATWQEELAHREADVEKSPPGENNQRKRSNSAPPRPSNSQVVGIERRRVRRENDLNQAMEQLQSTDSEAEAERQRMIEREKELKAELEEAQQALDSEVGRSKSCTAAAQRRYVQANAQSLDFEKQYSDLTARRDELCRVLAEAREDLQKSWESQRTFVRRIVEDRGTTPSSSGHPSTCSTPVGVRSITSLIPFFRPSAERMSEPEHPEAHVSGAPLPPRTPNFGNPLPPPEGFEPGATPSRATPPSMTEVRRRHTSDEALCSFYLQVYPLLKGADVQVWRKPRHRFEPRCLLLSGDLQRLEIWPINRGSDPSAQLRPPRRVMEEFVRIDSLSRVYVPRSTYFAVQQHILDSEPGVSKAEMVSGSEGEGTSLAKRPRAKSAGPTGSAPGDSARNPVSFSFKLVLDSAEPLRLAANEVQSFHVITTAIQALCSARGNLSSYASALGLQ